MKILITGLNGFVGPYLKKELEDNGYEVFGLDRSNERGFDNVFCGDIRDANFVEEVIKKVLPDEVYHLAGFSSVKKSFEEPELVMDINVGGTRNLLEAVQKYSHAAKILMVSSAEVYGKPLYLPVSETESLKVTSPYSKSRIEQEKLVDEFNDLHVIVSRSFNHTGPGQLETFVLAAFAKQIVDIKKGLRDPVIYTGNLDVVRDFSDVRDIVRAYRLLLEQGKKGEAYNVGSGKGYKLEELLNGMISQAGIEIAVVVDPNRLRPVEIMELIADISKIRKKVGWKPVYSMDNTIGDLLDYFYDNL